MSVFGQNLKKLLEQRGVGVRALAEALGIPPKTVHEWVGSGGRMPRKSEHLRDLAGFFGCSIHFLLFAEEDPRDRDSPVKAGRIEIEGIVYEVSIRRLS
jgi:transcriptional regulator with XRE-family HTH domain